MKKFIKDLLKNIVMLPAYLLPLKKKIVVSNFNGRGYGDNPKYIIEKLMLEDANYDIVWLVKDMKEEFPRNIRKVKIGSLRSYYELITASLWIDNVRNNWKTFKRKKQCYLQTWHGSYGPKPIEAEAEGRLSTSYIAFAKRDGKLTDGILASNEFQLNQMKNSFWLNKKADILKFGTPRNDVLVFFDSNKRKQIKDKLKIKRDKKIVLYMPTFRDNSSSIGYIFDFETVLKSFEQRFGEDFVMIVRFHPNVQKEHSKLIQFNERIIDGALCEDSQELLLVSDFLISDYSSAPFDFILLNKPVFLYVADLDEYYKERGLLPVFSSLPFSKNLSIKELCDEIQDYESSIYTKKLKNFMKDMRTYENGDATQNIVKWIHDKSCI